MKAHNANIVAEFATISAEDLEKKNRAIISYLTVMAILKSLGLSKSTLDMCSKSLARRKGFSQHSIIP